MKNSPWKHGICYLILSAVGSASIGFAQGEKPPLFNLGRHQDIGSRAMGLGGSYTAIANDFTALYYNPAGLSSVKKHELHFTLEQNRLSHTGRSGGFSPVSLEREDIGIQSLGYVLPIPTSRGGLSFALGFYKPRTFSEMVTYEDALADTRGTYKYLAEGDMTHYRMGMGLDLSPDVVMGLAIGYIGGEERITIEDSLEIGYLRTYGGFNIEPSLLFKVTPRIRMGASVVVKESFDLKDVYQERGAESISEEFEVKHPFQMKIGLGYLGSSYILSADYKTNNWSHYRIRQANVEFLDDPGYKNEHIYSVGAEKYFQGVNGVVRGGYSYNTLSDPSYEAAFNLHRLSSGMGFLISGAVSIDAGYSFGFWEARDETVYLENHEHRALLSFGYRY